MRQVFVAVFACLVVVFVVGAWRMPRPGEAHPHDEELPRPSEDPPPALEAASPSAPSAPAGVGRPRAGKRARPPAPTRRPRPEPGRLRVRAMAAADLPPLDCNEVKVFVAERAVRFSAHREKDPGDCIFRVETTGGVFQVWAVSATLSSAVVTATVSVGGDDRGPEADVELVLQEGAFLRGVLVGESEAEDDDEATLKVTTRNGGGLLAERSVSPREEGAPFEVGPLSPGLVDIEVNAPESRQIHVTASVPRDGLRFVLEKAPRLKGYVGRDAAGDCLEATLQLSSGEPLGLDVEGSRCRFESVLPEGATGYAVIASGEGKLARAEGTVPPHGDVDSLCVGPPCDEDDGRFGALRVMLARDDGKKSGPTSVFYSFASSDSRDTAEGRLRGRGAGGAVFCDDDASCTLEDLPRNRPIEISVNGGACAKTTFIETLTEAVTEVTVPCAALVPPLGGLDLAPRRVSHSR